MKSYYKYNPWQEKFDAVLVRGQKLNEAFLEQRKMKKEAEETKPTNNDE